MTTLIAILLYRLGRKPKCTIFIDEQTFMYGYGKLYGWTGVWQYNLPARIARKIEKQHQN